MCVSNVKTVYLVNNQVVGPLNLHKQTYKTKANTISVLKSDFLFHWK